jgi:cellulose biosynthesis protein BcsQ
MASAKGGSGKTVLTATFAAFLHSLGKRVLMIDTDAATNGLTLLYLKEVMLQGEFALAAGRTPRGVYEDLSEIASPEIVTVPTGAHLIPATYAFVNPEYVSVERFTSSLRSTIERVLKSYDYIFLDAQAGADLFAQVAMSRLSSHEVVIVSEYDPLSAAGVERLKGLLREELTYVRTWVLLNKMLPDFVQSFSDFMEVAKYASPIPWDADVVRAYARRKLAIDLDRGNEFTLAIIQTLKSLLGEEIDEGLRGWLDARVATLREPVEIQYRDAEAELEGLIRARHEIEFRSRKRRLIAALFTTMVAALGAASLAYLRFWQPKLFSENVWLWLAGATAIAGLVAYLLQQVRSFYNVTVDVDLKEARLRRQEEILHDRLKKLEALRRADAETLVRHQRGSPLV